MDVLDRADLPFPHSLPEFQRLFPDDAACAAYLEKARWGDGFACPHCGTAGEPFHFENRPGVLRCRKCRQNTGRTVGTVMERSHTPLNVWFCAAYLVASQTPDACPLCSFSGNLVFRATRRPFKFSTSSARAWCGPTKTGSVDSPRTMLRWTKPGLAGKNAWGRPWCSPQGSRLLCHRGASSKAGPQARQPERRTLCRIAFGSPSCSTVAPSRSVASSRAPSRRDR